MSAESPFELSRATIDDMPELIPLLHSSFPMEASVFFTGTRTADEMPRLIEYYQNDMREQSNIVWLKVVDKSTGKIVAGSEWRINVSDASGPIVIDPVPWLEGETRENTAPVFKGMNDSRAAAMPGPFVYLHICFTAQEYRRRGAGALMMQWGVDMADMLFLPAWIEASKDGNFLYKTFGFYDFEEKTHNGMPFLNMKRDVKHKAIAGGR